ncbi:MAG: 50S ribosomal protein L29 [Flavobacteriales bacterium MED-G22]|jgi:large subunit ribosomal protein L29|nr:MAG: 50S ribosomal protein L29 [Flavobacteriales bacterium MED-G22]|tara:strand:+ start:5231 stop:5419 length:189 start_codon:yes stop_codon:yes gene_type:complete
MKQSEIKLMEAEALQTKIGEVEKQLMELKLTHAVSPLENPLQIRATRRTLARLKTAFTNKQA